MPKCVLKEVQGVPRNHYVGGVSDGDLGFAAMDYGAIESDGGDGNIALHRSWFMLDDAVCTFTC